MVKTFLTNSNNDLYLDNSGNLAIGVDNVAILAACVTASKAQLGEMVLNVNAGLPNFQLIWGGAPNLTQYESALRKTLLSVSGVTSINDVQLSTTDNTLNYIVTLSTIFGTGTINGVV